jgi:hypothetical protein
MIRKFATIAALAGAALISTYAVYASHLGYPSSHVIFGKAYYYSLNFLALITKLTGRDIKDGTQLKVEVKILSSETACLNPQTFVINPGTGPKGNITLISDPLTSSNLVKSDRTKSTFSTTATGDLVLDEALRLTSICKDSPGSSQWYQLYWQDRNCIKGQTSGNTCYTDLARLVNGQLIYVTGLNAGQPVPDCVLDATNSNCGSPYNKNYNWTFVFLPSAFAMKANVWTAGAPDLDSDFYWSCQFKSNNETGANNPGAPYSFNNPPVNGWAGVPPAEYDCTPITKLQYDAL